MVIHNLANRELIAWRLIGKLHKLHINISWLATWLQNTSKTITTTQLIKVRDDWAVIYSEAFNFNTVYSSWFSTSWPDYAIPLTDALASLVTLNTIINNGLQANYWDVELDKPVVSEITQAHRNALATAILSELE